MMTKAKNSLESAETLRKIKIFSIFRLFCACIGLVISVTLISLASLSFKDMISLYKEQISLLEQIIGKLSRLFSPKKTSGLFVQLSFTTTGSTLSNYTHFMDLGKLVEVDSA